MSPFCTQPDSQRQQPRDAGDGLRLSKAIGRSPESWLAMQDAHDLWRARQHVNLQRVGKLGWRGLIPNLDFSLSLKPWVAWRF